MVDSIHLLLSFTSPCGHFEPNWYLVPQKGSALRGKCATVVTNPIGYFGLFTNVPYTIGAWNIWGFPIAATILCNGHRWQWQHQGGMGAWGGIPPPIGGSAPPPTCPPNKKKMAKISHFWQIFRFLPPQKRICPLIPPNKFLVPPLTDGNTGLFHRNVTKGEAWEVNPPESDAHFPFAPLEFLSWVPPTLKWTNYQ